MFLCEQFNFAGHEHIAMLCKVRRHCIWTDTDHVSIGRIAWRNMTDHYFFILVSTACINHVYRFTYENDTTLLVYYFHHVHVITRNRRTDRSALRVIAGGPAEGIRTYAARWHYG